MVTNQCIILAGGYGSRLGRLTEKTPKPLLKINNKKFVDYIIQLLKNQGFKKFIILTYFNSQKFSKHFKKEKKYIKVIKEKKKLGTSGSIKNIYNKLDSSFVVVNGDTLFDINIRDLVVNAKKSKANCFVSLIKSNNHYGKFSYKINKNYKVTNYIKSNSKNIFVSGGIYYFKKNVFSKLKKGPSELDADILQNLFKKKKLYAKIYKKKFIDIGTPKDFNRSKFLIPKILNKPACFLDRDGVINKDLKYVSSKERFIWNTKIFETIKLLNDNNYSVFVLTNQSGIARGYYKESDVNNLHEWVNFKLNNKGAYITKFYFCPYYKDGKIKKYKKKSFDRKPMPGMLFKAAKEFFIIKQKSFLIGDQITDIIAGKRYGIRSFFVKKNIYSQIKKIIN